MATQLQQMLEIVKLHKQQAYAHAAEAAHRYLQVYPDDEIVLQILADSAIQCGKVDAGERVIDLLLDRDRTASRLMIKATACGAHGDLNQAQALLREALIKDATHAGAWSSIATLHRFTEGDKLIKKAKRVLRSKQLDKKQRRAIHYALAKAMNDLGRWDQAWDHAERAGGEAETIYDPALFSNWSLGIADTFDQEFLAPRPGRGIETEAPIFIVGMPRSGTTLMERILTSAGAVAPMGEMTTIAEVTAQAQAQDRLLGGDGSIHGWTRRWNNDAFSKIASHYLQLVTQRHGDVPARFTDKLPNNLLYLAQIALLFPRARIIRMHRDLLDTCVSCYMGEFRNGHDYTYRADWLADAALGYARIGDQLCSMIPNPVLDVQYEALVREPEPQIRRVLEFVGVSWNSEYLTPSSEGYMTTTRSVAQVRDPINVNSIGRWRRYGNRIEPLARALGLDCSKAA